MITVEQYTGVGIHARYAIRQDGKTVATMDRGSSYRQPWSIYSVYYREHLVAVSKDINFAKSFAQKYDEYPTAGQVYERICQRAENERRLWMQEKMAHDFAALARDLAAGSNSAQERLIDLSNVIEAYAKDRNDTKDNRKPVGDQPLYAVWRHGETAYPDLPEIMLAKRAELLRLQREWTERQQKESENVT